jgi:two-component system, sporulation sensor kinase A
MSVMDGHRKIASSIYTKEETVVIEVSDNGPGIPKEVLSKLAEGVSTKKEGGGIGLVIVREIIEAYNGTFGISSVQGLGTKVTISLPKYNGAPVLAAVQSK